MLLIWLWLFLAQFLIVLSLDWRAEDRAEGICRAWLDLRFWKSSPDFGVFYEMDIGETRVVGSDVLDEILVVRVDIVALPVHALKSPEG